MNFILGIISFGLMAFSRKWKISEWTYISFAILSYTGRQFVYAFAKTKGNKTFGLVFD